MPARRPGREKAEMAVRLGGTFPSRLRGGHGVQLSLAVVMVTSSSAHRRRGNQRTNSSGVKVRNDSWDSSLSAVRAQETMSCHVIPRLTGAIWLRR